MQGVDITHKYATWELYDYIHLAHKQKVFYSYGNQRHHMISSLKNLHLNNSTVH